MTNCSLDARLEQPVLRRAVDLETGLLQRQRRRLGVLLGDHEIDVVYGFRTAVCPERVTAGQRELRPVLFERRGRALERVAKIDIRHRGYLVPMRMATFNILHGRSLHDGAVELDRFAESVRLLDADVLALQEVDLDQPRSREADLTALAAEAMGAVTPPVRRGDVGHTRRDLDGGDRVANSPARRPTASRCCPGIPVLSWQVLRLPRIPVTFPMYLREPQKVLMVRRGAACRRWSRSWTRRWAR